LYRAGRQSADFDLGDDGSSFRCVVNAAVRCAPPDNKPTPDETINCQRFLAREIELLPTRVVIVLGKFAFDAYLNARGMLGLPVPRPRRSLARSGCELM
jgi:uracil-DNA glycosylase family 4